MAFAQAEVIRRTALKATGGRTYGEMAGDDPLAEMAMNASLLRSSLFTSVLAFGLAGAQVGDRRGAGGRRSWARPDWSPAAGGECLRPGRPRATMAAHE